MALDTIPKQEGGKLKAVASGTLPSGQPVVVNADGTVSVVGESSFSENIGSEVVFEAASTLSTSCGFDSNSNKVVIAYRDFGNSSYGTAVVGTVSGNSITFGTPVVFNATGTTDENNVVFDSSNNKIVIVYQDGGNSAYGTAIVGTVSGTSISFGSPTVFVSQTLSWPSVTFDTSNNKVVISYADNGNSAYGTAIVGTVSGTSISFGSPTVFESANTDDTAITFDSSNNKVVIAYQDAGNSNYGTAVVGTVSGTSISFGTPVVFESADSEKCAITFDSNSNKVVIAYQDDGGDNSRYGTAIVGTVSGTSISFGSPVIFESANTDAITASFDSNVNKVVIQYRDGGNSDYGTIVFGTVDGNAITFTSPTVFNTANTGANSSVFDSNANKVVIAYQDAGNSSQGTAVVVQAAGSSTNLTSENYIGMSGGVAFVSASADQAIGTETNFETGGRVEHLSAAYDANAQKVVIAYRDNTNSNYGTAIVGTVSGTSISFGTAVVYHADATNYSSVVYDGNAQKVVIAYQDDNDSNKGTAIVGTISGTSISFGSPTVFDTDNSFINTVYDSNAQKIVISYNDGGNSDYGTAVVGTVSGTSISFGTPVVFATSDTRLNDIVYDSTAQKVVVAYRDVGNSDAGTAVVGTVSGTSISFGTPVVFDSGGTDRLSACYDTEADAVVVFYGDGGNSYYGTAIVGNVSGTSISFGTKQVFESAEIREIGATYDSAAKRAVLGYRDVGNSERGTVIAAQVSGTTMVFSTPEVFAQDPRHINAAYDSDQEKVVFVYDDEIASRGRSCVVQVGYTDITRGEVADGDAATVDIVGTVSKNQVGLTAGQQYYVQTDGTLSETPDDPSVLAGTAVSATKMVVKS